MNKESVYVCQQAWFSSRPSSFYPSSHNSDRLYAVEFFDKDNRVQAIAPPASNTYNYTPGRAGFPLYMLDLRTMSPGAVSNWAQSSSVFLLYGLGGQDLSTPARLNRWFDVIIHIQNTTLSEYFYASPPSR